VCNGAKAKAEAGTRIADVFIFFSLANGRLATRADLTVNLQDNGRTT
jgi:hypothetical protein